MRKIYSYQIAMENITIEIIEDGNIEQCRDLCNELMAFQKSMAILFPEKFDLMNFDTRMKKSYENSLDSQVIVVKDKGVPVGYIFSTIDTITGEKRSIPNWAPKVEGVEQLGFYPSWDEFPEKVGCLSNLYLRDEYRSLGLGSKIFNMAMEWLESFEDVNITFVYISNGNDKALSFYLKNGFIFSHDVFGGFIKAAYKHKNKI